jgi:hypothetical protein
MSVVMLDPLLAVSVNIDRRQYRASELPSERVNRAWDMQEIQPKMRRRADEPFGELDGVPEAAATPGR